MHVSALCLTPQSVSLKDFVLVNGNMQMGQCQKQFDLLITK